MSSLERISLIVFVLMRHLNISVLTLNYLEKHVIYISLFFPLLFEDYFILFSNQVHFYPSNWNTNSVINVMILGDLFFLLLFFNHI